MRFRFGVFELAVHDRWGVSDPRRIAVDFTGIAEATRSVEVSLSEAFASRGPIEKVGLGLALAPAAFASLLFSAPVVAVELALAAAKAVVRPSGEWIGYRKAFAAGRDSFSNAMRVFVGRALERDIREAYLEERRSGQRSQAADACIAPPASFLRVEAGEEFAAAGNKASAPGEAISAEETAELTGDVRSEINDDAIVLNYRAAIPGPLVWIYLIGFSLIPIINFIFIPFLLWAIVFMFAMRVAPRRVIVSDGVVFANRERLEIRKIKKAYVFNSVLKTLGNNRRIMKQGAKRTQGVNYMAGAALGVAIRDLFFDRPRASTAYHVCVDYGSRRVKIAKNLRQREADAFLRKFASAAGLK
ncbi:MAG: hypothetical protein GC152_02340 [Alphaproteobacteria bacterium]|nr:hypothetical protein [Alphaproteobacteria bacterium]